MPVLLDGLADENLEVQLSAVLKLTQRGEGGVAATPTLLKWLNGKDIELREAALGFDPVWHPRMGRS